MYFVRPPQVFHCIPVPPPYPLIPSVFLTGVSNILASWDYVVICNVNAQEHTIYLQKKNTKQTNLIMFQISLQFCVRVNS